MKKLASWFKSKTCACALSAMVALGSLFGFSLSAYAAIPTEITTALGDAKTDVAGVATLALIVLVALAAIRYMRRAL